MRPGGKLDSAGKLTWAHAYAADPDGSALQKIRQTADGGYVAAGNDYTPTANPASTLVLVAKFSATRNLTWQHGFTTPTSATQTEAIIQTSDGGYAVADNWTGPTFNGADPAGALLLKLDASGNLVWQHLYYQISTAGRPLNEDFQGSALAPDGGFLAIGPTLNYSTQKRAVCGQDRQLRARGKLRRHPPRHTTVGNQPRPRRRSTLPSPRHGHDPGRQLAHQRGGHLHQHPARLLIPA